MRDSFHKLLDGLEDERIILSASPTPSEFSNVEHDETLRTLPTEDTLDSKSETTLNPHPGWFFEDGNLLIRVGNVDFKVHRYFFMRDSIPFMELSKNGKIGRIVDETEHTATTPLVLQGISSSDFECFLSILYPKSFDHAPDNTSSYWTSVLRVADYLSFRSIRSLSIAKLSDLAKPLDKIVLGRQYGIEGWLREAYDSVCTRKSSLTKEEGRRLGVDEVVGIMEARQIFLWEKPKMGRAEVDTILDRIFGLESQHQPSFSTIKGRVGNIEGISTVEGRGLECPEERQVDESQEAFETSQQGHKARSLHGEQRKTEDKGKEKEKTQTRLTPPPTKSICPKTKKKKMGRATSPSVDSLPSLPCPPSPPNPVVAALVQVSATHIQDDTRSEQPKPANQPSEEGKSEEKLTQQQDRSGESSANGPGQTSGQEAKGANKSNGFEKFCSDVEAGWWNTVRNTG